MTIAPTDFREAHLRVWGLLESGLEADAGWREQFLHYGLIATVGFDQPFGEDDDKVGELAHQLGLPANVVVCEIQYFIRQNCLWTTDELVANMENVLQVLSGYGSPEQIIDCLLDFAPYARRPDVLRALRSAVVNGVNADEYQSLLPQFERQQR